MADLSISDDPFSRPFELSRQIRTIVFADGEPVEFLKTPTEISIPQHIIEQVEAAGRACPGFFTRTNYLGQK